MFPLPDLMSSLETKRWNENFGPGDRHLTTGVDNIPSQSIIRSRSDYEHIRPVHRIFRKHGIARFRNKFGGRR